jgi:hypothetical protein
MMRIPSELRLLIYDYLLDDGGHKTLCIRSEETSAYTGSGNHKRTGYRILVGSLHRQSRPTTYRLMTPTNLQTAIFSVNRTIYEEASTLLYSTHAFDFGDNIEAIVPFFSDFRSQTRPLVQQLSLIKQGDIYCRDFDRCEWANACEFLAEHMRLRKLALTVIGGKPLTGWEGIPEYTPRDFRLLSRYEPFEWIRQLAAIESLEELEVLSEIRPCPPLRSNAMALFIAFSASIDTGLTKFLKAEMLGEDWAISYSGFVTPRVETPDMAD